MKNITERENGTYRVSHSFDPEVDRERSLTKQSEQPHADINQMVAHIRRGIPVRVPKGRPLYGDFTHSTDYVEALTAVARAEEDFAELPAAVRTRFNNDPAELLDFIADEANIDEAIKLGLVPDPEVERAELEALGAAIGAGVEIPTPDPTPEG